MKKYKIVFLNTIILLNIDIKVLQTLLKPFNRTVI